MKRAVAPKVKVHDFNTNEHCVESKTSSRFARVLNNFDKLKFKIGRGAQKLRARPQAHATNQTASGVSNFALPLIGPEVTRSFSDETSAEFQTSDVLPKETSSSTFELTLTGSVHRTSRSLSALSPSPSDTASEAFSLPDRLAPSLSPSVSQTLSTSSPLPKKEPFPSSETFCHLTSTLPPSLSDSIELPREGLPEAEENCRIFTPIPLSTSPTLSESTSITSPGLQGSCCVDEPALPSTSVPSNESANKRVLLPIKDASQPAPHLAPSSSTSLSSRPSHSPVPSALSSASSMADAATVTNNSDGRAQWDQMKGIPDDTFKMLLQHVLREDRNIAATRVRGRTRGAYHLVVFVDVLEKDLETEHRFVVKVPAHGTPRAWTKEDEYMLVKEAEMLKYLYQNTSLPTSEIIDYSPKVDNGWGFPHIITTRLPGNSAVELWFDEGFDFTKKRQVHDLASPVLEKKRVNFLRSLAHEMTKLKNMPFNAIGMPSLGCLDQNSPPVILPVDKTYVWPSGIDPHYIEERSVCRSTQDYTSIGMDRWQSVPIFKNNGEHTDKTMEDMGMCMVLEAVFAHQVFQSAPGDTFSLQHNDLDLQNILVDDDGNITGIIDWDGSLALPLCVAHAAVPAFLRRDWFPDESESQAFRHLVFRTEDYRQIYAAAMVEAGNPDAIYTTKSGIYQAALASVYGGGHEYDFCDKLLREIPDFRMSTDKFLNLMASGEGWKFDEILDGWLDKILQPELPKLHMQAVLADVDARLWMTEWDGFLNEPEDGLEDDSKHEHNNEDPNGQSIEQYAEQDAVRDNEYEEEQDEQSDDRDEYENEDEDDTQDEQNEHEDELEDDSDDELLAGG